MLDIYPDCLTCFKNTNRPKQFVLIVPLPLKGQVRLNSSQHYQSTEIVYCNEYKSIQPIINLKKFKSADIYFIQLGYEHHFNFGDIKIFPDQRFFVFFGRKTTLVNLEICQYFLEIVYNTNYDEIKKKSDLFFKRLGLSPTIKYINKQYKTCAALEFTPSCLWTEVFGDVDLGEKGGVPAGELALIHADFADKTTPLLKLNGKITLHGAPILQANNYEAKTLNNRDELFKKLQELKNHAVIATIKNGTITELTPTSKEAEIPLAALEKMFRKNENYRIIFELGIGMNSAIKELWPDNCNMNETYANDGMCVHFGIGSIFAKDDFHLDIICPDTKIHDNNGNNLMVTNEEILLEQSINTMTNKRKNPKRPGD